MTQQFYSWVHTKHKWKHTPTQILVAASFTVATKYKQPKYPSTAEWINKMWYFSTMKYYFPIIRNKVLIHATIWMNLENTVIEASHKRSHIMWYHLYTMSKIGKSIKTVVVPGSREGGNEEWLVMGTGSLSVVMKMF